MALRLPNARMIALASTSLAIVTASYISSAAAGPNYVFGRYGQSCTAKITSVRGHVHAMLLFQTQMLHLETKQTLWLFNGRDHWIFA